MSVVFDPSAEFNLLSTFGVSDDPIFLKFEKGDLIKLLKTEELTPPQDHGWVQGWNERTGKTGSLSLQSVYIIPILEKPSSDVMVRWGKVHSNKDQLITTCVEMSCLLRPSTPPSVG